MYTARIFFRKELTAQNIQDICALFGDHVTSHTTMRENDDDHGRWVIEIFNETKPDLAALTNGIIIMADVHGIDDLGITADDWALTEMPDDIDWLARVHAMNPPLEIGPFFVYGSHYNGNIPTNKIGLNIDAVTAFGSGDHGTTMGCLLAMATLKDQGVCPWNTLDMGTGSGILAIAAWKLWKAPILAVDIDAESINVTRRHMDMNGVKESPAHVSCMVNPGFDGDTVQARGPFELVVANILAGPLMDMALDLMSVVDDNGYIVLSGIVNEKTDDVITAYTAQGLTLKKHNIIGEWSTLVLQKSPS